MLKRILLIFISSLGLMGCGGIASSISDTIGEAILPSTPGADFKGIYTVRTNETLDLKQFFSSVNSYAVYMGNGTVSAEGVYTAPAAAGFSVLKVEDADGNFYFVNILVTPEFSIVPEGKTLSVGMNYPFSALGGVAPFEWSVVSGNATINAQGIASFGSAGSVQIKAIDSQANVATVNVTVNPELALNPKNKILPRETSFQFAASGGVGPYHYELLSGEGSLNASTGDFVASANVGTAVLKVTDSLKNVDVGVVTITNPLLLNTSDITLVKSSTFNFSASGGTPPYSYSVANVSHGTINSLSGLYNAPAAIGTYEVTVADSSSPPQSAQAVVRVTDALSFSITSIALQVGESFDFTPNVSGGVPGYTLSVAAGEGTLSGLNYTAPMTPGVYEITVEDSQAPHPNNAKAFITVNPVLGIAPGTLQLTVNSNYQFSASGGIPPYTFSTSNGLISAGGLFTAPATPGVSTVTVTDSQGHTAVSNLTIASALSISPASLNLNTLATHTFSASGGVGAKTFAIVSGAGTINSVSGLYTASSVPGTVTVEVRDSLNNFSQASLAVLSPLQITPSSFSILKSASLKFAANGGLGPYVFSLVSGDGTLASDGKYTAPSAAGTASIQVSDSLGQQAVANVVIYDDLVIAPLAPQMTLNKTKNFSATGGVPPYTYSVVTADGGTFSGSTYTSPNTPGSYVVRVTDAEGTFSETTVLVSPALSISPLTKTLSLGDTADFTASNGVPPYVWSVVEAGGGSISPYGKYTASATPGSYTVRLTDADGTVVTSAVTVTASLSLSASKYKLAVGQVLNFSAAGGVAPYVYSIVEAGQGSIDANSGQYTAPANLNNGVSATIKVVDSLGHEATKIVSLYSALSVTPSGKNLAVNNSATFTGQGGLPPYTYSVTGAPANGTVNASGLYTAPASAGSYSLTVTDSDGNTTNASITVGASLQISPASVGLIYTETQTFTASGGVSPYSYSVVSGGGTINASTGSYVAGAPAGTTQVRVTDSLNNTSVATVTVTALSVTITTPTSGAYVNLSNKNSFAVSGACSLNGSSVVVTATGGLSSTVTCAGNSYSTNLNFNAVADGAITINATHLSAPQASVAVTKDTVLPTVTISSPVAGTISAAQAASLTVSGTCSEGTTVDISAAGGAVTATPVCAAGSFTTNLNLSAVADGNVTITANHSDSAGNAATADSVVMSKDATPPTAVTLVNDGQWLNSTSASPTITFTAGSDTGGSGIQKHQVQVIRSSDSVVMKAWADFVSGNTVTGLSLSDGTSYKVEIRTLDVAGNTSTVATSDGWTVDVSPPTVPTGLTVSAATAFDTETPLLSWTASTDSGSGVSVYKVKLYKDDNTLVGSEVTLASGQNITSLSLTPGVNYKFAVSAVDSVGNQSAYSSYSATWLATKSDPCLGTPTPGTECEGGAIYLGSLSPGATSGSGTDKYMTTPGGCGDIPAGSVSGGSGPSSYANADFTPTSCSGNDATRKYWNDGTGSLYDIPNLTNYTSTSGTGYGGTNTDNKYGNQNAVEIVAITAAGSGGYHAAARYCDKLDYGGYKDWYLPSRYELNLMWTNKGSIPGLDVSGNWYWSSTEYASDTSWIQRFDAGLQSAGNKNANLPNGLLVRCVRRF
ncbi:MAG: DUF1566 domain-containing protein [Bdellovibrio sp.]|nr:DUF1566 domain-containing protein [Bdellovibrio sp.]